MISIKREKSVFSSSVASNVIIFTSKRQYINLLCNIVYYIFIFDVHKYLTLIIIIFWFFTIRNGIFGVFVTKCLKWLPLTSLKDKLFIFVILCFYLVLRKTLLSLILLFLIYPYSYVYLRSAIIIKHVFVKTTSLFILNIFYLFIVLLPFWYGCYA